MENENTTQTAAQEKNDAKWLAYCRIPGGMQFKIQDGSGDEHTIVLKSGTEVVHAADGSVSFRVRPDTFGITELTAEEKRQIESQIKPSRVYKSGFIFFCQSKDAGEKKAAEQVRKNPHTGMEPLDAGSLTANAQAFSETN